LAEVTAAERHEKTFRMPSMGTRRNFMARSSIAGFFIASVALAGCDSPPRLNPAEELPRSTANAKATMTIPQFENDGIDRTTFAPVKLIDQRNSNWKDVRLSFDAWEELRGVCGGESVEGYYLNGHGVQGLIRACRFHAGLDPDAKGINYNSEADTCFIHFSKLEDAVQTAQLASDMLKDRNKIAAMIRIARAKGFDD
jgi:hypothetical protein